MGREKVTTPAGSSAKASNDSNEIRSAVSQEHIREELQDQVEAFLASGGEIQHVDPHVTADPPKKPSSNYGSRPI